MSGVAIISGSASDSHIVEKVKAVLDENNMKYDIQVLSAHRNPVELEKYVTGSDAEVFRSGFY